MGCGVACCVHMSTQKPAANPTPPPPSPTHTHTFHVQIARRNPATEAALCDMDIPGLSKRHRSTYGEDIVFALQEARAFVGASDFELNLSRLPSVLRAAKKRRAGDDGATRAVTALHGRSSNVAVIFAGAAVSEFCTFFACFVVLCMG